MSTQPISVLPEWVEPAAGDEGSIDPLGFAAEADEIADKLLPGVTVATTRIRYLSFLCWAIRHTGNDVSKIDQWEIALSVGEYIRHKNSNLRTGTNDPQQCKFLGSLLLKQLDYDKQLRKGAPRPAKLRRQTARIVYSGLLRSCGLTNETGDLSDIGRKIADDFGRDIETIALPTTVQRCGNVMPCLSKIGAHEQTLLRKSLLEDLEDDGDAARRRTTYREIKRAYGWKNVKDSGHRDLLKQFLVRPNSKDPESPANLLHRAAKLDLRAFPLTRLFLVLYKNEGRLLGKINHVPLHAFRVRETPSELLSDVAAHLRKAASLERLHHDLEGPTIESLKRWLLWRHREQAKHDDPWVDEHWAQRRRGLPSTPPNLHPYRLRAFASLVSEVGG